MPDCLLFYSDVQNKRWFQAEKKVTKIEVLLICQLLVKRFSEETWIKRSDDERN